MQSKIEKSILENIPEIKKRGWVFSLVWKVFKISKVKDISEIWTIYRSLKSNNFDNLDIEFTISFLFSSLYILLV